MYCKNCGKQIRSELKICPYCSAVAKEMTHKQHFVPQCYLQKWYDETHHLYGLAKQYNNIKPFTSSQCCYSYDEYEISKGKTSGNEYLLANFMEDKYGEVETQIGLFYKKIIPILDNPQNAQALIFNGAEKAFLKLFITTTIIRNPSFDSSEVDLMLCDNELKSIKDFLNVNFPNFDNKSILQNLVGNIRRLWDCDLTDKSDNPTIGGHLYRETEKELFDGTSIYILKSVNNFITSDVPFYIGRDFLYFPLSPSYACVYTAKSINAKMLVNKITVLTKDSFDECNKFILNNKCSKYVYANNKQLLERYQKN